METTPLTAALHPKKIFQQIRSAGVTDVVTVPDTHQRTLLRILTDQTDIRLITVCTEDEALGVNLGLYMGGRRPLVLVQNTGLFASLNAMRGICLDGQVPTCLLIGEHGRNASLPPRQNTGRAVNLLEPTLELWKIPFYRLDCEADLTNIPAAAERAWESRGPAAVIVGSPTGEE